MNTKNLYKLATHEDTFHLHKVFGIFSIIIYFLRLGTCLIYHDMYLNNNGGVITFAVHGMLSMSSFIFTISNNRHSKLPIIYPEFRLHNTLFAFRSIICALNFLYFADYAVHMNMGICYITMYLADIVSAHYKSVTTTMRLMPYMDKLDEDNKKKVVKMHSFMQLVATYYMTENINTAYSPILAIQISSFLMTLVKKGIITTGSWHYLYSLALWLNIILLLNCKPSFFFIMNFLCCFMYYWRIISGRNKYLGWTLAFGSQLVLRLFNIDDLIDEGFLQLVSEQYISLITYVTIFIIITYFHIKFYRQLINI